MPESQEPQKYEALPPSDTFVWRYLSLAKLLALFRARALFAFEQEVRVIRLELPTGPAKSRPGGRVIKIGPPPENRGIEIPVDLAKLIEAIHLAPASPAWMFDVVAESMRRFELGPIPCRQSTLDQLPDFGRYGI